MRTACLIFAAFASQAIAFAAEPTYTDHARVMVYRDADNQEHPVKTPADWAIRRRHILAGMEEAMGKLPDRSKLVPLDVQVTEEIEQEGVARQTISYVAEIMPGGKPDRVTAYLWLPSERKAGKRLPAMLALHPTGALGKGIVAGMGPRPNRAYGLELAQRGYVVLAPDYLSFGDLAKYDFKNDPYISGTMKGIWNHMRSVDVLAARDDVDPERIGAIGHSLGGHNSMFVGVFDQRLKVIVSSCGWCPFHDYYGGKIAGWTSDRYMPLLRDKYDLSPDKVPFDFYEVVSALAPRAFFSASPMKDANFDVVGVKKAIPVAQQVYDLLGASDRLQVRYPGCEHDFPNDMRREAYAFIDRILEHQPTREIPESQ
jgi:acetyl esterase/lipase